MSSASPSASPTQRPTVPVIHVSDDENDTAAWATIGIVASGAAVVLIALVVRALWRGHQATQRQRSFELKLKDHIVVARPDAAAYGPAGALLKGAHGMPPNRHQARPVPGPPRHSPPYQAWHQPERPPQQRSSLVGRIVYGAAAAAHKPNGANRPRTHGLTPLASSASASAASLVSPGSGRGAPRARPDDVLRIPLPPSVASDVEV